MGSDGRPAELSIVQDDSVVVRCLSNEVLFASDGISANHATFSLILGEDSISHPDIKVNYLEKQKVFRATRQEDGVGLQPFVDSYHALEFEVEVVEWPVKGSIVEFQKAHECSTEPAPFRSVDSFVRENYDAMRGVDNIHPLARLSGYSRNRRAVVFHSDEYAAHLGVADGTGSSDVDSFEQRRLRQFQHGLHDCQVQAKDEQRHIDARAGRIDYDVVAFNSNPTNGLSPTPP